MKVYKDPFVTRESYFVKTGALSGSGYLSLVYGYSIDYLDGKWEVRKTRYHLGALAEMPVVAENHISLQGCIDEAIREAILFAVKFHGTEQKSEGDENSK